MELTIPVFLKEYAHVLLENEVLPVCVQSRPSEVQPRATKVETRLRFLTITVARIKPRLPTTSFSDLKQTVQSGNDDFSVTQR